MILYLEFLVKGQKRFSFYDDEVNQFLDFKGFNSFGSLAQFEAAAGTGALAKLKNAIPPEVEIADYGKKVLELNMDEAYCKSLQKLLKQAEKREDYTECHRIKNELKKYKK